MTDFNGLYQLNEEDEKQYLNYIKSFDILDDESAKRILDAKKLIRISNSTQAQITVTIGDQSINWIYGKKFMTKIITGHQVNAIALRNGNTVVFGMIFAKDPTVYEEKVYQFTEDGIVAVSTSHLGVTSFVKYKRMH
ncbi:uncharacterized protein LOC143199096 [Rhynchophorus ferrugineus]|uniref:uncharacterized protein LOC143199096 n=1 Tax=Rhynchophorus ferrugineus TaxID=354439 RepID=UPI003FCD5CEC